MKTVPFIVSTIVAAVAFVLSIINYTNGNNNIALQAELQKKQNEVNELKDAIEIQQKEYQRQSKVIQDGAAIAQKAGPPILRDIGLLATKNKNEKLKMLLVRQKLESFIPTDEQVKQIEEQMKKSQAQPANPAPAAPPTASPSTPSYNPAPR
jgi:hypothetical protein